MQQDMTVKHKCAGDRRVAEIHTHLHAVVGMAWSLPKRYLNGVTVVLSHWLPIHLQHQEVNLVHVKGVGFKRAVLYGPVFNRTHLSLDHRLFVCLEDSLLLSLHRYVELNGSISSAEFLGEEKVPLRGRALLSHISELEMLQLGRGRGGLCHL